MSVPIDRAHHHPRVYKRLGYWQARCPRCGLLRIGFGSPFSEFWEAPLITALRHATEVHS